MYRPDLLERPRLIAANKIDAPGSAEIVAGLRENMKDIEIFPISALTGEGVDQLVKMVYLTLTRIPEVPAATEEIVVTRFKDDLPFKIAKADGAYEISGDRIEKLVAMTNFANDEALPRFQHIIEKMGINQALRDKGIKNGDLVRILDLEFEYQE